MEKPKPVTNLMVSTRYSPTLSSRPYYSMIYVVTTLTLNSVLHWYVHSVVTHATYINIILQTYKSCHIIVSI